MYILTMILFRIVMAIAACVFVFWFVKRRIANKIASWDEPKDPKDWGK